MITGDHVGTARAIASRIGLNKNGAVLAFTGQELAQQNPITKAQALRQAQLSLLRGESSTAAATDQRGLGIEMQPGIQRPTLGSTRSSITHLYYWAPFVLIGNGL